MIRFSALLVALAIGLLVAGVAASNLPLVYVSIAVCAMAALLLAAGVLRHWSEIFGSGSQRPAVSPFAASQPVTGPAAAGWGASRPAAASGYATEGGPAVADRAGAVGAPGLAGFRADAGASPAGRGPEPTVASGRYRSARRPAEPEPESVPAEPVPAARSDDLWDRVNEELESAGKRDSGRLSWPAGDYSIPSGMSLPAEPPPGQETLGQPGSSDLWQPAAGWQPPTTPPGNWPFGPAAEPGSAGSGRQDSDDGGAAGGAAGETVAAEPARRDEPGRDEPGRDEPGRGEPGRDEPGREAAWDAPRRADARRSTTAPDDTVRDDRARDDTVRDDRARDDGARAGAGRDEDAAPPWTIRPPASQGTESTVVSTPPVVTPPARAPEPSQAAEPAQSGPGAETAEPADDAKAAGTAGAAEPAEASEAAGADAPGKAEPGKAEPGKAEPGKAEPGKAGGADAATQVAEPGRRAEPVKPAESAKPAEPAKPAGPVRVTVVPGVARYHRGECILIRFLGEDDLEIMPKQQAVADGLTACRACQPDQLPDS